MKDAAWYYPEPKDGKAEKIKDHVAFCEYSSDGRPSIAHNLIDKSKVEVKSE